jgi:hypothetical protein
MKYKIPFIVAGVVIFLALIVFFIRLTNPVLPAGIEGSIESMKEKMGMPPKTVPTPPDYPVPHLPVPPLPR